MQDLNDKNERTSQEVEADIALRFAEIRKIEAETKQIELQIERTKQDNETAKEDLRKELAADSENNLYRFGGEITSLTVKECIVQLSEWHRLKPKSDIEIVFSSQGGEVIEGFELFDFIQQLRNSGHKITTGALGMAASMAGILLQAGDVRWIGHQSWLMIHRTSVDFSGGSKIFEIDDEVKFVKRIEERDLDIFTSRSKLTKNQIKKLWDRKDWWINAEECLELKLVDEIKAIMPELINARKKV